MDERLKAVLAELRRKRQSLRQNLQSLPFWPNICSKVPCEHTYEEDQRDLNMKTPSFDIPASNEFFFRGDADQIFKDSAHKESLHNSTIGDHSYRSSNQKRKATVPIKFLDASDRATFKTVSDHDYVDFPQSPVHLYEKKEVQVKTRRRSNSSCRSRLSKVEPTKDSGVADFHGFKLPYVLREEEKYFVRNHLRQALSKFRNVTSAHFGVACNSMFKSVQCLPEEKAAIAQLCKDLSLNYSNYSCLVSENDAQKVYEWMRKGLSMSGTPPTPDTESGESMESVESSFQNQDTDHPPLKFVILDKKEMKKKNGRTAGERKNKQSLSQKKRQNALPQFRKILPKVKKEVDETSTSCLISGENEENQEDSPKLYIADEKSNCFDDEMEEDRNGEDSGFLETVNTGACPFADTEARNSEKDEKETKPPQCEVRPVTFLSPLPNPSPGYNITFGASSYLDGVLYETQTDRSDAGSFDSKANAYPHHRGPDTQASLDPSAASASLKKLEDTVNKLSTQPECKTVYKQQSLNTTDAVDAKVKVMASLKETQIKPEISAKVAKMKALFSPKKEKVKGISSPRITKRKDMSSPKGVKAKAVPGSREAKVKPLAPVVTVVRPVDERKTLQEALGPTNSERKGEMSLPATLPVTSYLPVECVSPCSSTVERGVLHAYLCKHALSLCIRCVICEKFFSWYGFSHHSHEGDRTCGHDVETRGRILLDSKDVTPRMLQLWETVLNRVRTQPVSSYQSDVISRPKVSPRTAVGSAQGCTGQVPEQDHNKNHMSSQPPVPEPECPSSVQSVSTDRMMRPGVTGHEGQLLCPVPVDMERNSLLKKQLVANGGGIGQETVRPSGFLRRSGYQGSPLHPNSRVFGFKSSSLPHQFSSVPESPSARAVNIDTKKQNQPNSHYSRQSPLFGGLARLNVTSASDHNNNCPGKTTTAAEVPKAAATTFAQFQPKIDVPVGVVTCQPADDSVTSDTDLNRMRRQLGSHRYFIHHLMEENEYLRNMLNLKTQANNVLLAQMQNLRMRFHRDVALSKKVINSMCGWKKADDVTLDSDDEIGRTDDALTEVPLVGQSFETNAA
ncbi:uncharacterized protein LOC106163244 isoform X2 [Lingula anatina]|uniref:Uncharacterized protein LOC106163244 isoform X2 n=1 Tax=Lingula anatina TaxID=7574 RepID=A0A1S3IDK2_LINAN|nr:uncharacterized protein LOC106163244 isoform X2 [Lingula anatina]|eukprot:XP_013396238.1 uncharacterized protein LOC106163244 isoform X2 [Lingula anatina]